MGLGFVVKGQKLNDGNHVCFSRKKTPFLCSYDVFYPPEINTLNRIELVVCI